MTYISTLYVNGKIERSTNDCKKIVAMDWIQDVIIDKGLNKFSKTTKSKDHKIGIFSKWEKGDVVLTANFEVK